MPHTPVAGYTEQPPENLARVNEFKQDEERLLRKLDALDFPRAGGRVPWVGADGKYYTDPSETTRAPADPRWIAIARAHFQEGFMALNRAVMQPQRIALPEDDQKPT